MEREFLEQYKVVFDENNAVRLCGRANCKKLISIANEIDPFEDYGNIETGFMNVENLIALSKKIKKYLGD